jgi:hypothetical protein
MESFDQSLKYLLQHQPADFLRFGLRDPTVQVLGPLPSDLPSRGRDIDGSYLIERAGMRTAAHLEFHRRHQRLEELAVDVAEAQIRLYRREQLPVLSQVWDLYGNADEPLLTERTLRYGAVVDSGGSQAIYQRINLRALGWEELLTKAPAALWPLVALTRDGAQEQAVQTVCEAIEARTDLRPTERADHLAVLWFVAEAEDVPTRVMKMYISEGQLMESELYKSAIAKGKAWTQADTIVRILTHRLGALDPSIRERIRGLSDSETLACWYEMALQAVDAKGAEQLLETIRNAPLP